MTRNIEANTAVLFQTPSERGGIPLMSYEDVRAKGYNVFQTPSERGGIPLNTQYTRMDPRFDLFQTPSERGGIPLVYGGRPGRVQRPGFKPLQSGAGFLCHRSGIRHSADLEVSNPFRAGRDSSVLYLCCAY